MAVLEALQHQFSPVECVGDLGADAFAFQEVDGFRLKLWRGESMT
jgi:hypothetical protein